MANFYLDNEILKFHLNHPMMKTVVRLRERDFTQKDKYDFAPLYYEDAIDSYNKVMEIVGEISADIIDPNAESVDSEGPQLINNRVHYAAGTVRNLQALNDAGLNSFTYPREFKGSNFPILTYVMAAEILSRADAGFVNIYGLQDCGETIREFASQEIKEKYLPMFAEGKTAAMILTEPDAGSDLQAVSLSAKYDEGKKTWLLNGVKRFITNGDADISLILARSEEGTSDGRGLSLFLYERDKTVTIRRIEHKLGIVGSPTCEMVFKDSPALIIGERRLGLIKYVMSLMNAARLGIGGQSVGIAEACYREALKYAKEREQFGKKINNFPAVYEMLTNMKVMIQAARTLLYETAIHVDVYKTFSAIEEERKLTPEEKQLAKKSQKYSDIFTPLIKLVASEYCNKIAYDAIQIHGGTGFMMDFPVQRYYRDARITSIYEGTTQLQVVAAIRGVTNGTFLNIIKEEYQPKELKPELEFMKKTLAEMTEEYEIATKKVIETKDNEFLDFHARRLVEMVGNIVMGYLMITDSNRNEELKRMTEIFIKKVKSENKNMFNYVMESEQKDIPSFKYYI
ncbi:MAG: acyl-CoA dehydrogenase [Bacteroidetes bacterium GWE2_29_8]|nr:MAG: acyl-CoA dehydrogenase [Bacteroidetes bacterium GWE2_29_8]OFY20794.1 MAG: acyl-CoA dehydrogenase [Bacteroidetes bacterium GWF2_29_10]